MSDGLNVIITGSTGMVGEGVLLVCLQRIDIRSVLVISRKHCGITHPKLTEILHDDFYDLSLLSQRLTGYEACFFCLGISSVGVPKDEYYRTTYTLTLSFAQTLSRLNPGMSFCYISGAGTSPDSRQNWSRVKAKTESDLQQLPFKAVYGLRPGFIKPLPGQTKVHSFYKYIGWLFPIGRKIYPEGFCTIQELAVCMIYISRNGFTKNILGGKDIIYLGNKE